MDFENVTEETYKDDGLTSKIKGAVDYDLIDNSSPDNNIIGKMHKKFVRMDNRYFKRFFDSRRNAIVSYSTYFTEEDNRMNYVPELVSTLVKKTALSRDCVFETYVPEVLNKFNTQTVYNTLCNDEDGFSYVASIDFIKPNERLVLFSETGKGFGDFGYDVNLEQSVKYVVETIESFYQKEGIKLTEDKMREHLKDFVKSYLVRVCLLKDNDFTTRNNGFLINDKEKSIRLAPNFDFELCFRLLDYKSMKEDILFAVNNFPDVIDKYMQNLENFTKKKDGVEQYKLLYDEVNGTERYKDAVLGTIEEQAKQIKEEYNMIKGFHFE